MSIERTVAVRCPEELWLRVARLAKFEHRSGQSQLNIVIERGLRDLAGVELAHLSEERSRRLMSAVRDDF